MILSMKFNRILDQIDYEIIQWRKLTGEMPHTLIVDVLTYHRIKDELEMPVYLYLSRLKGMRLLVMFTDENIIEFI